MSSGRGYEPRFDLDLERGEQQELRVDGILSDIRNGGQAEIKSDFYDNGAIFCEVQDRRLGRAEYRDTGWRTTASEFYILNNVYPDAIHIYRTEDLRRLERMRPELLGPLINGGAGGDCPTKGYKVTAGQLDGALALLRRNVGPVR